MWPPSHIPPATITNTNTNKKTTHKGKDIGKIASFKHVYRFSSQKGKMLRTRLTSLLGEEYRRRKGYF